MKEETLKKINTLGKAGDIIAKICRVFLIIGFVGILIGLVAILVLPKDMVRIEVGTTVGVHVDFSRFGTLSAEDQQKLRDTLAEDHDDELESYEVTESTMTLHLGKDRMRFGFRSLIGVLIVALLYVAASYISMRFIGLLCRAFRNCRSPFDEDVIRRMRNFAFSLIPWAVLSMVSDSIVSKSFMNLNKIGIGINLGTVLLVLLILGLCRIFRYGAELQKEHDETL